MTTADDPEVRQAMLYHLNSFHIYEEVKAMEPLQFPATFENRWTCQEFSVNQLAEMWDPIGGSMDFEFFHNKEVWRAWLRAVRNVVMDWDGFDSWDWGLLSDVKTLGINSLLDPDVHRLTIRLLAFYIQSFVSRLGIFPSPLLRPSIQAVPSCPTHRRKFGHGYPLFVM
jgi:hypothetical protein